MANTSNSSDPVKGSEKGHKSAKKSPDKPASMANKPVQKSAKEERLEIRFLTSAAGDKDLPPEEGPEVAIAGRSNAGKSSFLNRLAGHRQLARVSKTPGRTQLLNFFEVRSGGRLVDLPGYGYAKATRNAQAAWQKRVNTYLSFRDSLAGVVLVMDIRHPFQPFDDEMLNWSAASELPLHILLNKADKLKSGARSKALMAAQKRLEDSPTVSVQTYSALKGLGQLDAIAKIQHILQDAG